MNLVKKLPYIDSIRGIAIIGVLMVHCGQNVLIQYPTSFQRLINNGARGVQLFFLISAFTIFLSLSKEVNFKQYSIVNFYIKRFLRIAPMYYIGIIYYMFQNYHENGKYSFEFFSVLFNIFFVHGVSPYTINNLVPGGWSITVEIFFYLCVPLLFVRIKNCNDALRFFIVTLFIRYFFNLLLINSNIYSSNKLWQEFVFFYFPNQLPVFAIGIFLFFLIETPKRCLNINVHLLLCILTLLFAEHFVIDFNLIPDHILFSLCCVFFVFYLSRKSCIILVNPLTVFIGRISYSMYLVHFAILHWMHSLKMILMPFPSGNMYMNVINYSLNFLLLLFLSIIVSVFCYYLIEKKFIQLGKNIIRAIAK